MGGSNKGGAKWGDLVIHLGALEENQIWLHLS